MTVREATPSRAGAIWAWVPALLLRGHVPRSGQPDVPRCRRPQLRAREQLLREGRALGSKSATSAQQPSVGLEAGVERAAVLSKTGKVLVQLSVTDRQALPVSGANVVLDALLNAYADRVQRLHSVS